jgi:hypothetical protein
MTIINHSHRFVFVHIPKNAGTSVAHYLSQLSTYRDQEIGATELGEAIAPAFRGRFQLHKHSTFAEIEEATGPEIHDYTSVAVVRDPVDRVRSLYSFLRQWPGWTDLDPAYERFGADPVDRVRSIYSLLRKWPGRTGLGSAHERFGAEFATFDGVDAFIGSDLFLEPGPDRLFLPQTSWLSNAAGESVAVDHLVRYESLESDLSRVVDALGLPAEALRQPLPRANVSNSSSSNGPLTPASLSRVHERYRLDYELLGPWASQPEPTVRS